MPWYPGKNGLRAGVLEYMKVLERLKNQSDCTPSSFPFYGPFLRAWVYSPSAKLIRRKVCPGARSFASISCEDSRNEGVLRPHCGGMTQMLSESACGKYTLTT
ncbi:hypothetical protein I308_103160 [Cryptococcus tetragattii IND107]|uniref:Uncharacterized protein n=1 Tax=Cryptococcus tetragattii IND107 TaxID=1296105 RepID=A0ABR3BSC2_9TREE